MDCRKLFKLALGKNWRLTMSFEFSTTKEKTLSDTVEVTGAQTASPVATAPAVDPASVVNSVVSTVTAHPDIPASAAPAIIGSILSGLYAEAPAIFAISRASTRTQGTIGIGLDLLTIILGAFLKH